MPPSFLPPPPDIGRIAGPLLVGYLLHWGLFGVLSTQVYIYYLAFPKDARKTKALVYGVYVWEVVQTVLFTYTAFNTFAKGFGNFMTVMDSSLLWFSVPIISSGVAFVVQVFYAYRIYILSNSKIISILIILLALGQLAGGIATGVIAREVVTFTGFLVKKTYIATGIWNGCSAVCDVLIAGAMTFYLQKRSTGWKPTQRIIQRLIRLIIETGTLTAAIAIVNLILSLLPGKPTYFQATSGVLGKLYSNTMMVVFNSRMRFGRNDESESDTSTFEFRSGARQARGNGLQVGINPPPQRRIVASREHFALEPFSSESKKQEREDSARSSEQH